MQTYRILLLLFLYCVCCAPYELRVPPRTRWCNSLIFRRATVFIGKFTITIFIMISRLTICEIYCCLLERVRKPKFPPQFIASTGEYWVFGGGTVWTTWFPRVTTVEKLRIFIIFHVFFDALLYFHWFMRLAGPVCQKDDTRSKRIIRRRARVHAICIHPTPRRIYISARGRHFSLRIWIGYKCRSFSWLCG